MDAAARNPAARAGGQKTPRRLAASHAVKARAAGCAPGKKRRLLRPAERVCQRVRVGSSSIRLYGEEKAALPTRRHWNGRKQITPACELSRVAEQAARRRPRLFELASKQPDEAHLPAVHPHAERQLPVMHNPALPRVCQSLVEHPCGAGPTAEEVVSWRAGFWRFSTDASERWGERQVSGGGFDLTPCAPMSRNASALSASGAMSTTETKSNGTPSSGSLRSHAAETRKTRGQRLQHRASARRAALHCAGRHGRSNSKASLRRGFELACGGSCLT